MDTPTKKHETDEHGKSLSTDYLDYARADVQVTWECYSKLVNRFGEHGLSKSLHQILSEASIGKGYLQEMGIKPFLVCHPTFPREMLGEIFCAYYGSRAEVRNRRVIREVIYCDFKSMYPTVNALMDLWKFVIAEGVLIDDTTMETQDFLDAVTVEDLQRPATWRKLCTLVQVQPDEDIFPVRAKYNEVTNTIGLNYLTATKPLWFTLGDCIVSKLLAGKSPKILKARSYRPGPCQSGLKENGTYLSFRP